MIKLKTTNLLFALLLAACSIQLPDSAPAATRSPNLQPPTSNLQLPTSNFPPFGRPTPTPLPWSGLQLGGHLLFTQGTYGVQELDLAAGAVTTLFKPPDNSWLTSAALSPDGKQILLAYAPPPPEGQVQFGYTGLYLMPSDGSGAPLPLLERADPQESYFTPAWSPDGSYIYFGHFTPVRSDSGNTFKYTVERMAYPDGLPEMLIENGLWPRVSPDGSKLAYLSFDPESYANELYLADPDGKKAAPVMPAGTFTAVDAHMFSPDGSTIIFSAVGQGPSPALSWLDQLLGVQIASAHNVPSDWWSVPATGGQPTRLSRIFDTGLYGDFSPDGEHIAFIAASGLYVMNPDGSDLQPLAPVNALGTLEWIP